MAVRVCEQNCSPQGGRDGEGEERERDVGLERETKVIGRGTQTERKNIHIPGTRHIFQ